MKPTSFPNIVSLHNETQLYTQRRSNAEPAANYKFTLKKLADWLKENRSEWLEWIIVDHQGNALQVLTGDEVNIVGRDLVKTILEDNTLAVYIDTTDAEDDTMIFWNGHEMEWKKVVDFSLSVNHIPIASVPPASGNTENLNELVTDPNGQRHLIDFKGDAENLNVTSGDIELTNSSRGVLFNPAPGLKHKADILPNGLLRTMPD